MTSLEDEYFNFIKFIIGENPSIFDQIVQNYPQIYQKFKDYQNSEEYYQVLRDNYKKNYKNYEWLRHPCIKKEDYFEELDSSNMIKIWKNNKNIKAEWFFEGFKQIKDAEEVDYIDVLYYSNEEFTCNFDYKDPRLTDDLIEENIDLFVPDIVLLARTFTLEKSRLLFGKMKRDSITIATINCLFRFYEWNDILHHLEKIAKSTKNTLDLSDKGTDWYFQRARWSLFIKRHRTNNFLINAGKIINCITKIFVKNANRQANHKINEYDLVSINKIVSCFFKKLLKLKTKFYKSEWDFFLKNLNLDYIYLPSNIFEFDRELHPISIKYLLSDKQVNLRDTYKYSFSCGNLTFQEIDNLIFSGLRFTFKKCDFQKTPLWFIKKNLKMISLSSSTIFTLENNPDFLMLIFKEVKNMFKNHHKFLNTQFLAIDPSLKYLLSIIYYLASKINYSNYKLQKLYKSIPHHEMDRFLESEKNIDTNFIDVISGCYPFSETQITKYKNILNQTLINQNTNIGDGPEYNKTKYPTKSSKRKGKKCMKKKC